MNYCKCFIGGHLTRDIEIRTTGTGTSVGNFSLAVNRQWKTESGEKREDVSCINCVSFGKQADTLAKFLKKGDPLFVEGRLKQDTWDDKETGKKRSAINVVVESFQFMSKGQKDSNEPPDV
jgi:single-strand DNA-binding protein